MELSILDTKQNIHCNFITQWVNINQSLCSSKNTQCFSGSRLFILDSTKKSDLEKVNMILIFRNLLKNNKVIISRLKNCEMASPDVPILRFSKSNKIKFPFPFYF